MASLDELRVVRLGKIEKLKKFGMDAYPASVPRDYTLSEITSQFESLLESGKTISIVGRVMSIRGQGAIMFVTLFDGTDRFQAVFKKDEIDEDLFNLFSETVDLGDFISVTGTLFVTQKGAQSLLVNSWTIATKALLPIPSEFYGLEDEEDKMRKRYLDAVVDQEVFKRFETRLACSIPNSERAISVWP